MSETIRWWLVLEVVAAVQLPLCLALLGRLPDRGYALSKPFALLFLGFTFWFLNSLHVLPNRAGGIVAALVLLGIVSAAVAYRYRDEFLDWAREHWRYIVGVEVLFLVTFAVAVWMRALVGQISGTEQPMDLMFLNAAAHAEHFPPKDPWLSGHTVAYYYFGYLIVMMNAKLAGVPMEVAYNIGLGMIASLSLVGAFGLVYNLVFLRETATSTPNAAAARPAKAAKRPPREARSRRAVPAGESGALIADPSPRDGPASPINWKPPVFGLAGGLMLVVMGNLAWVLFTASAWGIGGAGFYKWIDIMGLTADEPRKGWYPSEFFNFFDASRIYPLSSAANDRVITEFPMFSFLLGDLHPHVMALPFVLVVVGAALSLFRSPEPLDITYWLQRPLALIGVAVLLGGLAFINTWDVATMGFLVVAAAFVSNFGRVRAITFDLFIQTASFALPLAILALALYSPFLVSIAGNSQADGVGAVVTRPGITDPGTRPLHLFLYWGPLFVIVLPLVALRLVAARERITSRLVMTASALPVAIVAAWAVWFLFQKATDSPKLRGSEGLLSQIADRGSGWLTAIFVAAALASALLALMLELTNRDDTRRSERTPVIFVLTIAATALLLILGTEFFYVGDVFNSRMNTVFKLYYQAWTLLAVAAGFALYYLASAWEFRFERATSYRAAWAAAVAIVLAGAALYPLGGTLNRTDGKLLHGDRQLDGLSQFSPSERAGIAYLKEQAQDQPVVIAEAVGNDYSIAGRVSAATGLPTIIGWKGHEDQWRSGDCKPCTGRFEDANKLYTATDMGQVQQIVQKYDVTYIYVGDLERSQYGGAALEKFKSLTAVYQSGNVTIYRAKA